MDHAVEDAVRSMLKGGELILPMPRRGGAARRWASLAGWGRSNLAVARLAEGHTDAVAILVEAGLAQGGLADLLRSIDADEAAAPPGRAV
jgi:hypothetical protein